MDKKIFVSKTPIVVRYAETDQMGIVHHSNYAVWFEAARTDFIKQLKSSYSGIEKMGVLMPLTDLAVSFKRPARYEQTVTVETRVDQLTPARIVFAYEVYNEEGALLARGTTHHAWTNLSLRPLNIVKKLPEVFKLLKNNAPEDAVQKKTRLIF